ncbi:MAG: amidohydrolase family protein [Planctomycetaceae bacterium]|nr:amidohydrolase family protein [Planctomycetaceae bacterium]
MLVQGRHFETGEPVQVHIDGELIAAVEPLSGDDKELPWLAPGLFDIQVNGYGGIWFSRKDLTVEHVIQVCESLATRGISLFLPTLITASEQTLITAFQTLEQARRSSDLVNNCVVGYHLEGPWISKEDGPRGAHPREHVRPASVDEFLRLQHAAGGRIRLLTLAADCPGALDMIRHCHSTGVRTSIGHTAGTSSQIQAAASAGATLSTHLGNGAHGRLPRHPNYLWDQLADDRLWASVIADGHHLPDAVLKCVLKCKGPGKTILTCDVSGFAGCPPGTYREENVKAEVLTDGRLVVAGQRQFLAGSGATTGDCLIHMMRTCGITLPEAIQMTSSNPARFLDMSPNELKTGKPATLCAFQIAASDGGEPVAFQPVATYTNGRVFTG